MVRCKDCLSMVKNLLVAGSVWGGAQGKSWICRFLHRWRKRVCVGAKQGIVVSVIE